MVNHQRLYLVQFSNSYKYTYIVKAKDRVTALDMVYKEFSKGLTYTSAIAKQKFKVELLNLNDNEVKRI